MMKTESPLTRVALALCLSLVAVVFAGCGEKKRAAVRLPAAPEIVGTEPDADEPAAPKNGKVLFTEMGYASWYGPPYHNRRGANGEIYNMNRLTAAHRTLPLNSIVRVTNVSTRQSVVVKITDRGPFVSNRIIDLSLAAAKKVDVWRRGTANVKVELLQTPAALDHGGRWAVQIGAFDDMDSAAAMQQRLTRRYHTAKVIKFS